NTASTNFAPAAFIAGPDGAILANWVSGTTTLSNLTTTGTYTVGVYSLFPGGTGNYSLSLYFSKLVPASFRLALEPTNGAAALRLWGEPGRATTLRYATNFATPIQWFTLTNFSLPWSPYRFVDESAAGAPQRFYQTVQ